MNNPSDSSSSKLSVRAQAFLVSNLIASSQAPKTDTIKPQSSLESVTTRSKNDQKEDYFPSKVKVDLLSHELWSEFHSLTTEMIITKAGR